MHLSFSFYLRVCAKNSDMDLFRGGCVSCVWIIHCMCMWFAKSKTENFGFLLRELWVCMMCIRSNLIESYLRNLLNVNTNMYINKHYFRVKNGWMSCAKIMLRAMRRLIWRERKWFTNLRLLKSRKCKLVARHKHTRTHEYKHLFMYSLRVWVKSVNCNATPSRLRWFHVGKSRRKKQGNKILAYGIIHVFFFFFNSKYHMY